MAYMDKETAKNIRLALKKEFPSIKFSVRIFDHMSLCVAIMKSTLFDDGVEFSINEHQIFNYTTLNIEQKTVLDKINTIIKTVGEYFDESDAMTDYFNTAFYYNIQIGTWEKPHVKI